VVNLPVEDAIGQRKSFGEPRRDRGRFGGFPRFGYSARLGTDHATVPPAKKYPRGENCTAVAANLYWEFQRHLEPAGGEIETEGDFWAVGQRTNSIHRSVPFQKAYGAIQAPKPYPLKLASSFLPLQNHKVLESLTAPAIRKRLLAEDKSIE